MPEYLKDSKPSKQVVVVYQCATQILLDSLERILGDLENGYGIHRSLAREIESVKNQLDDLDEIERDLKK
jgi:hypothetical protein